MPNTFTNLLLHVLFGTKHRKPLITQDLKDDLDGYIGGMFQEEDIA